MKAARYSPLRYYPVVWVTAPVAGWVSWSMGGWGDGALIFGTILPAALAGQWCIRWTLKALQCPVWLRRVAMLVPTVILLLTMQKYAVIGQRSYVGLTLGGKVPWGLRDVLISEDAWTDDVIRIYLRCDPASLKQILERPPFKKVGGGSASFSFDSTIDELRGRPKIPDAVSYRRTDMGSEEKGSCYVTTDTKFSFAYIVYMVD